MERIANPRPVRISAHPIVPVAHSLVCTCEIQRHLAPGVVLVLGDNGQQLVVGDISVVVLAVVILAVEQQDQVTVLLKPPAAAQILQGR